MGSPTRRWRRSFERFDRTLGFFIGAIVGFVLVFFAVAADGSTSRQALEAGAVGAVAFGLVCALFGDRALWALARWFS